MKNTMKQIEKKRKLIRKELESLDSFLRSDKIIEMKPEVKDVLLKLRSHQVRYNIWLRALEELI